MGWTQIEDRWYAMAHRLGGRGAPQPEQSTQAPAPATPRPPWTETSAILSARAGV